MWDRSVVGDVYAGDVMLRFRRKKGASRLEDKQISEVLQKELGSYIRREELLECLEEIEKDKEKRRLWDSLSVHKKAKLLRYVLEKKGVQDGKK